MGLRSWDVSHARQGVFGGQPRCPPSVSNRVGGSTHRSGAVAKCTRAGAGDADGAAGHGVLTSLASLREGKGNHAIA
jgi:hypothetical protein